MLLRNGAEGYEEDGEEHTEETSEEKEIGDAFQAIAFATAAAEGHEGKDATGHEQNEGDGGELINDGFGLEVEDVDGSEHNEAKTEQVG